MTREEAISEWTFRSNHIKKWLDEYGEEPSIRHYVELIDMAIEALSADTIPIEKYHELQHQFVMLGATFADLTEVVRCKDCRRLEVINTENTYAICHEHDIIFEPFEDSTKTNFCSWGERREK